MDFDTLKTVLDVGLGCLALMLYRQHGQILQNHEVRITILEAHKPKRKRKPREDQC